jgi:hypothetical protein
MAGPPQLLTPMKFIFDVGLIGFLIKIFGLCYPVKVGDAWSRATRYTARSSEHLRAACRIWATGRLWEHPTAIISTGT